MKTKQIYQTLFLALLTIVLLPACKKTIEKKLTEQYNLSQKATIQVYNGTINSAKNYVYADNKPVTGSILAYGSAFPASYGFTVDAGTVSVLIKDTSSTTTQTPLTISQFWAPNAFYSVFTYDTITAAKQKTVLNDIEVPDDTTARLRFVNLIHSKTAIPSVDIFSIKRNGNVFTSIPTGTVTGFLRYAAELSDTLLVRETGTTNLLFQLNGLNLARKRSYTLVFRGRYQSTSGTLARTLTSFLTY
ncbi:MAG TPA: hypothetical protein VFN30_08050 [Chitinophagaceae bacterium]|nr:hypothetical protein [Chitinophagaceae bacterium]